MYFNISNAIVDRTDLTLEEKMACVVMARYANNTAFEGLISVEVIALKMGVCVEIAEQSIASLKAKGLIVDDVQVLVENKKTVIKESNANIIKGDNKAQSMSFNTFDNVENRPIQKEPVQPSIDEVGAIFEEVVPKNRVKILFGLANQDLTLLERAYMEVKKTHKFDVIDALAEFLQTDSIDALTSYQQDNTDTDTDQHQNDKQAEVLDHEEADALLQTLSDQSKKDTHLNAGKKLNTQINLGRVQNLYKTKLKK